MKIPKFFHPLFLLVLGLHAGLLMIPVSGSSDDVIPAPDPEGDTISVTRIPPIDRNDASLSDALATPRSIAVQSVRQPQSAPQSTQRAATAQGTTATPTARSQPQARSTGNRQGRTPTNQAQTQRNNSARSNASNASPLPDLSTHNQRPSSVAATNRAASAPQEPPVLSELISNLTDLPTPLVQLLKDTSSLLSYDDANTTEAAAETEKENWLTTLRDRTGKDFAEPEALDNPVKVSYPLEKSLHYERDFVVCLSQTPHPAAVGIVVNSAGEIMDEPALLRSTGYEFLNQEALALAKDYETLPQREESKTYTIDIDIDYDQDACLSRSEI